jgi:dihydrodipicolinate synthase/N-acetylneuraminate lyase
LKLAGILPPLVTPFRADGGVDLEAFEANLESYSSFDLGGYLVLGSNGEAASLEDEEKVALIRSARRLCGPRLLLAGTGLESTRATIAFTRRAAEAGADAALVLTPHYYKAQMTHEALRAHFERVADASPVPVLLYSVPVFTSLPFPPSLAPVLAGHPNISGMKESGGDLGVLGRIVSSVPASFQVACGSAPVVYPALCLGAVAGILAVACCAPGPAAALYQAFRAGDHARARRIQAALTPLAVAVTATWGVAGLKAAMDAAGLRGGFVRAPLLPVPASAREEVAALLAQAVNTAG